MIALLLTLTSAFLRAFTFLVGLVEAAVRRVTRAVVRKGSSVEIEDLAPVVPAVPTVPTVPTVPQGPVWVMTPRPRVPSKSVTKRRSFWLCLKVRAELILRLPSITTKCDNVKRDTHTWVMHRSERSSPPTVSAQTSNSTSSIVPVPTLPPLLQILKA